MFSKSLVSKDWPSFITLLDVIQTCMLRHIGFNGYLKGEELGTRKTVFLTNELRSLAKLTLLDTFDLCSAPSAPGAKASKIPSSHP